MNAQVIVERHYADLRPLRFIMLSEQISQLYEGPWVQVGSSPKGGANNPNPADQEKARMMWRKAYKRLKPYEKMIYEDYQAVRAVCVGAFLDKNSQAIEAMYELCEAYHNYVELWDEMLDDTEDDLPYEMKKAMAYLAVLDRRFKDEYLPIVEEKLQRWLENIPEEKREEAIKKKQDDFEGEMRKPGFVKLAEEDVELSNIFVPGLKANRQASAKLLEVLKAIDPKVNTTRGMREEKWKWPHVKDALLHLNLIDPNSSDTIFGTAIHILIPSRTAESVHQTFKSNRKGFHYPTEMDKNIIADIVKEFQVVRNLLKS